MAQDGEDDTRFGAFTPARHRSYRAIGLILSLCLLVALVVAQIRGPAYEAQAVVQVRLDSTATTLPDLMTQIESHLLTRDVLEATALRHGMTGEDAAVDLRRTVALHALTSTAGATLGLAPEVSGVVISARSGEPEQAVRVANDLALQVLDLGQSGQLDPGHDLLTFYRGEEARLWQEVSALRAEVSAQATGGSLSLADAATGNDRRLDLLQDQYDLVRHDLAEAEIAGRLAERQRSSRFTLLQRATAGVVVQSGQLWLVLALLGACLMAGAFAFRASAAAPNAPIVGRARRAALYRLVDDPERPIWGLPRFAVVSAALVAGLTGLSLILR
jgi:hypothetical protein